MKKFTEFVNEKEDAGDKKNDLNTAERYKTDYEYHQDILKKMSHLDPENRNNMKNKLINMFTNLLENSDTFPKCVDFVMKTSDMKKSGDVADSIIDKVSEFFKNPKSMGLGHISGQNDVINGPKNPKGYTNSSNYQ